MSSDELPSASLDDSLSFLRWWRADGPWVLTRITPDRKGFQTRTFREGADLNKWLTESYPTHNIYFHVNPTTRDVSKKAEREDIKELAWLHVDIDPRAGENIDAERTRAYEMLTDRLPPGIPPPSAIVFSGGGYQGFWRLSDPVPINGQEEAYEDAKRYNQALELAFGADNCHNVDRIMRLPGSINWPDEKKRKKGRVATRAESVRLTTHIYPIAAFTQAARVQMQSPLGFGGSGPGGGIKVEISGNVPRIADISELDQWGVSDRVKIIAIQGNVPDETKKGDNSRSAWVFDFCCNMQRHGVPDEVIFSILMDPDYLISASILDKGSNAERYAKRNIERAREYSIDPMLQEFNQRFAVIGNLGGKCRVIEEVQDNILHRSRLTRQSFDDFRARWMHRYVEFTTPEGKTARIPAGKWWLQHPNRRYHDHLVFDPKGDPPNAYNLWRGYGVTPKPGNAHQIFLDHTREIVCGGNEKLYEYIMHWLARMVQHPELPGEVAIVLRGGMGIGKGIWAGAWLSKLWGRHALQVTNPGHLVGNFNSHLRDTCYLFADEAFYAGDKRHENILRTLITERTIMIEAKGVDAEQMPNFLHIIMASNHQWVVPAGMDERRYLVLDVSDRRKQDHEYFKALLAPLQGDGPANLLHHLLHMDISEFNIRKVPSTDALVEQKIFSMAPEEEWWLGKLEAGAMLPSHVSWETDVNAQDLQTDYEMHLRNAGVNRRATPTALGRFLAKVCPPGTPRPYQKMAKVMVADGSGFETSVLRRQRFYEMPTLERCRDMFTRRFGFEGRWLTMSELTAKDDKPEEPPF